uniref:LRAT domain-containing protein n=1 Tax=Catharus ustulatus TaxID=91951 RepID=A0A8C3Y8H4_CATUS
MPRIFLYVIVSITFWPCFSLNFKEYPMPGDLIEIDRPHYQHWALYVGDGYVIHVTPIGENSPPSSAGSMTLLFKKAKVEKDLLDKAAGKDNWRVNNKYDNVLIPFPVEEIIWRAECQVGRIVPYFLLYKNCEHFVTKLRYGEAVSEQSSYKPGSYPFCSRGSYPFCSWGTWLSLI